MECLVAECPRAKTLLRHLRERMPFLAESEELWLELTENGIVGQDLWTFFERDCRGEWYRFVISLECLVMRRFFPALDQPWRPRPFTIPSPPQQQCANDDGGGDMERTTSPTSVGNDVSSLVTVPEQDWVFKTP